MKKVFGVVSLLLLVGLGGALWLRRAPDPSAPAVAAPPVDAAKAPRRAARTSDPAPADADADAGAALHTLRIRVRAEGDPAPGATVWLDGVAQGTPTDAAGRWQAALEAAPKVVGASQGAYAAVPVTLSGFPKGEIELAVAPSGRVDGTVTQRSDGAPVPGAQVTLGAQRTTADARGAFAFARAPCGRLELTVNAAGYVPRIDTVDVSSTEPAHLALALDPGAALAGAVVDEDGNPLPGAAVTADFLDKSHPERTTTTDGDGRFAFPAIPLGWVGLRARADGFAPSGSMATAPSSTVKITLLRGGELQGTVFGADGAGVAQATVSLKAVFPNVAKDLSATADPTGQYHLTGIASGAWTARASIPGAQRSAPVALDLVDEAFVQRDFHLPAGGATVRGTVTDARSGKPLEGARVSVAWAKGKSGSLPEDARTDAQGTFVLGGVPAGAAAPAGAASIVAAADRHQSQTLPVDAHLTFALTPGLTIKGRVVDSQGVPLHDFSVGDHDLTPVDGRFRVVVAPDTRKVEISQFGFKDKAVEVAPPSGAPGDVDLGDVALDAAAQVTVAVFDPQGQPDPGAGVYAWHSDTPSFLKQIHQRDMPLMGVADASGVARFHLEPAHACFIAFDPRYPPSTIHGCPHVVTDQGGHFEVHLPKAAWAHGHVYAHGQPASGWAVVDIDEDRSAAVDASGAYRLGPLSAGQAKLFSMDVGGLGAVAPGRLSGARIDMDMKQIALAAGQDLEVNFGSPDSATLEVDIQSRRAPDQGLQVAVAPGPVGHSKTTQDIQLRTARLIAGRAHVRFENVAPGQVSVVVMDARESHHVDVRTQVAVGADNRVSVDYEP